jgi:hypothetical protein
MLVSARHCVFGIAFALLIVPVRSGFAAHVDTSAVTMPALEPLEEFPGLVSALSLLLVPKVVADGVVLKIFVCSEEFAGTRERWGDAYAVDVLFRRAQNLCWSNTFCALLTTFLAVMDHRRVGVRTPVPGLVLWFPLSGEFPEEYALRVQGLPCRLSADSPETGGGDRDKLQHFFGSALLAHLFDSADLVDRVGEFIEWGEERIIVGGVNDQRDLEANRRGRSFGLRLRQYPDARPSVFLTAPLGQPPDSLRFHAGQERLP